MMDGEESRKIEMMTMDSTQGQQDEEEGMEEVDDRVPRQNGNRTSSSEASSSWIFVAGTALLCLAIIGMLAVSLEREDSSGALIDHQELKVSPTPVESQELYTCPALDIEANNEAERVSNEYLDPKKQPLPPTDEEFLKTYRSHTFDAWCLTFEDHKKAIADFREEFYLPYLKSGGRIYESAMGLGFNTYMTLEILQERGNVSNITVYGNEYLAEQATKASQYLDALFRAQTDAEPKNQVGSICHGDSTDLSFVPANSMDLVFTGYISPLWDALELGGSFTDNYHHLYIMCKNVKKGDWKAEKLKEIVQQRQYDWYSTWTMEMIRIAKPGAPIILEEVSLPYCENFADWGGVPRSFWEEGVERYGWDVDPTSVKFGTRTEDFDNKRYNVFLLKNKEVS